MTILGITGGVGTGKSTVSRMLAARGAGVLDADHLAHLTIQPDGAAYAELVRAFGPGILRPDRTIDRRELGRRAFAGPDGARRLNSIVHPHVIAAIQARVREWREAPGPPSGPRVLVLDVPLLFESGLDRLCDQVWVVTATPEAQQARVMLRDGPAAAGAVLARGQHQLSLEDKMARADAIIDNSGSEEQTLRQVERLWSRLVA